MTITCVIFFCFQLEQTDSNIPSPPPLSTEACLSQNGRRRNAVSNSSPACLSQASWFVTLFTCVFASLINFSRPLLKSFKQSLKLFEKSFKLHLMRCNIHVMPAVGCFNDTWCFVWVHVFKAVKKAVISSSSAMQNALRPYLSTSASISKLDGRICAFHVGYARDTRLFSVIGFVKALCSKNFPFTLFTN